MSHIYLSGRIIRSGYHFSFMHKLNMEGTFLYTNGETIANNQCSKPNKCQIRDSWGPQGEMIHLLLSLFDTNETRVIINR